MKNLSSKDKLILDELLEDINNPIDKNNVNETIGIFVNYLKFKSKEGFKVADYILKFSEEMYASLCHELQSIERPIMYLDDYREN